jgi:hypothetical protein
MSYKDTRKVQLIIKALLSFGSLNNTAIVGDPIDCYVIQGAKERITLTQRYTFLGSLGETTILGYSINMCVIQGTKESVAGTRSYTFLGFLGDMGIKS